MKDRHGNEWVMVPAKATDEMIAEMLAEKDFDGIWPSAIAAAPKFEAADVTDEMATRIWLAYNGFGIRHNRAEDGRDMIAAVRSELGPALGLVSREEMAERVEATYKEIAKPFLGADELVDSWWLESNARKQLESK